MIPPSTPIAHPSSHKEGLSPKAPSNTEAAVVAAKQNWVSPRSRHSVLGYPSTDSLALGSATRVLQSAKALTLKGQFEKDMKAWARQEKEKGTDPKHIAEIELFIGEHQHPLDPYWIKGNFSCTSKDISSPPPIRGATRGASFAFCRKLTTLGELTVVGNLILLDCRSLILPTDSPVIVGGTLNLVGCIEADEEQEKLPLNIEAGEVLRSRDAMPLA